MAHVQSLKKKLTLLLLHCEKPAVKIYGVKLEIQPTKSIIRARNKFEGKRKTGQINPANASQQLYKGMTLKTELDGRLNYYGYKGKELKDKAASINIKRVKKITEIISSYTIKDVAKIYQPLKSLQWKYATNRSHKIRSLSNSNKRKLNESWTPSFQNANPSQYSLNSDISTDKFSEKNGEAIRITPKVLQTIDHDIIPPYSQEITLNEERVSQIRLQHSKDRSKSYNVLEKSSSQAKISNMKMLREGLKKIYNAFCKFKERNEKIMEGKVVNEEVKRLKEELEKYAKKAKQLESELEIAKSELYNYEHTN